MTSGKLVGLVVCVLCLLGLVWRGMETSAELQRQEQILEARYQEQQRKFNDTRAQLAGELDAIQRERQQVRAAGDEGIRKAKRKEDDAVEKAQRAERERKRLIDEHWAKRWFPGSEVSKKIFAIEQEQEHAECDANRARIERDATKQRTDRQVRILETKRASVEQRLAALQSPTAVETALPGWWGVFLGTARVPPSPPSEPQGVRVASAPAVPTAEAGVLQTYSYRIPDVTLSPAPMRRTSIFAILDVRSASEVVKILAQLGKEAQAAALRWWNEKEKGSLVDIRLGCKTFTADKQVAEAAWRKYHYFLAQTEGQCELLPTSTFRDVFKQVALKERAKKGGTPAADWWKSDHVMGMALDESDRCQNRSWSVVPFDFDSAGQVIFVKTDAKGNVVHDATTREAILRKRRAEFPEDYKRLVAEGGDVRRWEAVQYEAALHELLKFGPGAGIYGAHVMSFEAGLKAGLVGAYCGIRNDPLHSQRDLHGSTAECGDKLGGVPQCYRVDRKGNPDCWRGSPVWNAQVEHQRRRLWGAEFAARYGPDRLAR